MNRTNESKKRTGQAESKNKARVELARPARRLRSPDAGPSQQPSGNDSSVPLISQSQSPGHTGDYSLPILRSQSQSHRPRVRIGVGRRKARELITAGRATKKEPY